MQGTGSIPTIDISDHSGDMILPIFVLLAVAAVMVVIWFKNFGRRI